MSSPNLSSDTNTMDFLSSGLSEKNKNKLKLNLGERKYLNFIGDDEASLNDHNKATKLLIQRILGAPAR